MPRSVIDKEIQDEEEFYRSFPVPDYRGNPAGIRHYEVIDGKLRFLRTAWNDRSFEPSVDRACLVAAKDVIFKSSDGVIKIQASAVRIITEAERKHDVVFDPMDGRPAHSKVISNPVFSKKEEKKWKAFQTLLSLEAAKHGWVIEPEGA